MIGAEEMVAAHRDSEGDVPGVDEDALTRAAIALTEAELDVSPHLGGGASAPFLAAAYLRGFVAGVVAGQREKP